MKKPGLQPPTWFVEAQRDFGNLLRTPLQTPSTKFEVVPLSPDAPLAQLLGQQPPGDQQRPLPLHERLEIYQKQYWMRLFSALQETHPYTSATVSPWHFNKLASLYYQDHPPRDPDLGCCGLLFLQILRRKLQRLLHRPSRPDSPLPSLKALIRAFPEGTELPQIPRKAPNDLWYTILQALPCALSALHQAMELDKAIQKTFHTEASTSLEPGEGKNEQFYTQPLRLSAHTTLIREHWAMAHLTSQDLATQRGPLRPTLYASPRFWVFSRSLSGPCRTPISPVQALLLSQSQKMSIRSILERLQKTAKPELYAQWEAHVPQWIEQAIRLNWWSGFSPT